MGDVHQGTRVLTPTIVFVLPQGYSSIASNGHMANMVLQHVIMNVFYCKQNQLVSPLPLLVVDCFQSDAGAR